MKKLMTLIALVAIAGTASAVLVEDFTGAVFDGGNTIQPGQNWKGAQTADMSIPVSGGNPDSYLSISSSFNVVQQAGYWFDLSGAGLVIGESYKISFDYNVVGVNGDEDFALMVGENNGFTGWDAQVRANGTTVTDYTSQTPGNVTFDITEILTSLVATNNGWTSYTTTGTFSVDASDTHVFIGFGVNKFKASDGSEFGIDNVSIIGAGGPVGPAAPVLTLIASGGAPDIINWTTEPGYVYSIHYSTNLSDGFLPLQTGLADTVQSWTNTIDASQVFYQVEAQ